MLNAFEGPPDEYTVEDFERESLTRLDQCDRCIAPAMARVVRRKTGGPIAAELLFCGHHLNKYAEPLTDQGWTVT